MNAPLVAPAAARADARELDREAQRALDVLLIDHANCEKKAASTALALMFAYAEDLELAEQDVAARARGIASLRAGREAHAAGSGSCRGVSRPAAMRSGCGSWSREARPQREVDLMICGAFIEARSCERFAALGPRHRTARRRSCSQGLHAAEARHFKVYLELARRRAQARGDRCGGAHRRRSPRSRRELIASRDAVFRFHSGAPG